MSTQATVIGSYDAVRRSRDAQDQRSRSADGEGDNLMKGRTFIPRMSAESRKLLIEAMQRAKKKRQERLAKKKGAGEIGSALSTDITQDQKNKADLGVEEFTSDARFRGTYNQQSGTTGTGAKAVVESGTSVGSSEKYDDPQNINANGGKIPRYNKKRTIKYRR